MVKVADAVTIASSSPPRQGKECHFFTKPSFGFEIQGLSLTSQSFTKKIICYFRAKVVWIIFFCYCFHPIYCSWNFNLYPSQYFSFLTGIVKTIGKKGNYK